MTSTDYFRARDGDGLCVTCHTVIQEREPPLGVPIPSSLVGSGTGTCFSRTSHEGGEGLILVIFSWQKMREFSELDQGGSYRDLCSLSWEPDRLDCWQKKGVTETGGDKELPGRASDLGAAGWKRTLDSIRSSPWHPAEPPSPNPP